MAVVVTRRDKYWESKGLYMILGLTKGVWVVGAENSVLPSRASYVPPTYYPPPPPLNRIIPGWYGHTRALKTVKNPEVKIGSVKIPWVSTGARSITVKTPTSNYLLVQQHTLCAILYSWYHVLLLARISYSNLYIEICTFSSDQDHFSLNLKILPHPASKNFELGQKLFRSFTLKKN